MAYDDPTRLTSAQLAHDPGDERIEVIADINSLIVWRAAPDGTPLQSCAVSDVLPDTAAHGSETWLEAVHSDDRERVRPIWRQAIAAGTVFQAYYRLRQPDGTFRWSYGCGVPLLADDGSVREWIGTIADIDDRMKAQRSRSDERILLALAHNRIGVFDLDRTAGTVWCSETMAEIVGPLPDRPLSTAEAWALVHPDDRAPLRARIDAASTAPAGRFEAEFRLIHVVTGAALSVACTATALADGTGTPVRLLGTIRDVSDRPAQP